MLFARPEVALKEMVRVCKKGGAIACLVQGDPERMVFTSLVMKTLFKHAPELTQSGAPNLYAFAPVGLLDQALAQAGLGQILSRRLAGTFSFNSPQEYWAMMTSGAGRTGALLRSLPEDKRRVVEQDVLEQASRYAVDDRLNIPYEVVMAKGVKP